MEFFQVEEGGERGNLRGHEQRRVWCARGRGMLMDLGVTGEVAALVPEGRL